MLTFLCTLDHFPRGTFDEIISIRVNMKTKSGYKFRLDAAYVIAGGLGRSSTRRIVGRGARNLIILLRSGAGGTSAKALMAEPSARGESVSQHQRLISAT